jgi:hypothetical protein
LDLIRLRNRILPALAVALFMLLLVLLLLSPADVQLGNIVKIAYVHGALIWVGLLTFSVAGALGLGALMVRRAWLYRGTQAAGRAALIVWVVYVLSAMLITGLTWGQLVAWGEPRVRATGMILLAAVVLAVVARFVDHRDFTAGVNLLMGILPWIAVAQADAIRHPVDPIGSSQSSAIQSFYLLILLAVAGLALTLGAWLWAGLEMKDTDGH